MGTRLRFTSIAEFSGFDEDALAPDCVRTLRHRAESLFPGATVGRTPVEWCGGRPLTPDDRPISGPAAPRGAAGPANLYVHSGGGAYGWRVSCGVSRNLAGIVAADLAGGAPPAGGEEGAEAGAEIGPSLEAAAPLTSFEDSVVSIERFRPLKLLQPWTW